MSNGKRLWIIFGAGAVGLGIVLTWFLSNFLYDLLWAFLEDRHIKQANTVAFVLAHIIPFISSIIIVALIYFGVRYELARNLTNAKAGPPISPVGPQLESISEAIGPKSLAPEESAYMTAREVLYYMVEQTDWGDAHHAEHGGIRFFSAIDEIQKQSQDGKIQILGRLWGEGPHVHISPHYWLTSVIDLGSALEQPVSRTRPAVANQTGIPTYTDLTFPRADVYKAWPRRSAPND
jgi:hypothetical protein